MHEKRSARSAHVLTALLAGALTFAVALPAEAGGVNLGNLRSFVLAILDDVGLVDSTGTNAAALGPASSVDSYVSVFSGTTGKLLDDRPVTIDASGNVTAAGATIKAASVQSEVSGVVNAQLATSGSSGVVDVDSGGLFRWSVGSAATNAKDTDLRRSLAGVVAVGNGAATEIGRIPLVLTKSVTSASTTAVTTEETLWSYSLPAGTLASDGQAVLIRVRGYMAANTNNKTVALKFGSTTLHTFSATNSGLTWQIEALVQRSGATAQLTSGLRQHSGGFSTIHGSASETLANAITISLTGTNATASAGDITFDAALVEFKP